MGWRILVFYPEPEARDTIYKYPPTHVKIQNTFWPIMNYFDSDMSNSTNRVVYFDWNTVIYIYLCGQCRTQFMLPNSSRR